MCFALVIDMVFALALTFGCLIAGLTPFDSEGDTATLIDDTLTPAASSPSFASIFWPVALWPHIEDDA